MSFQKISDQPGVVAALKSALEKERLPHALLFQGPADSRQREAAAELAKAIFCIAKSGMESCDTCYHCRQVDQNSHPDFFILEPDKDARDIKIEAVRQLIARASLKPFNASAKVFVIDPAERMNDVAQNALLKTLEEPLGRTVFVLISAASEGLLPTIRSRVQILNFTPITKAQNSDPEEEPLKRAVLEYVFYHAHEPVKAPDLSKLSREELTRVLDALIEVHRDLLLLKMDAGEILRSDENLFEKERLVKDFNEEELEDRIEFFGEMKEKVNVNLNVKLVLSFLWETLASATARKS